MTPQERTLVQELFDRLVALENSPRDRDAERVIVDGLRRAPNAVYALVQTVLVQEEALKAADARIQELESRFDPQQTQQDRGFLEEMRESLFGRRDEPRGSVPSVPPRNRDEPSRWAPLQGGPASGHAPMGGPFGSAPPVEPNRGGSFLGTAAAAAAGVVGGALLLNTIRSAFGSHSQGPFQGALDRSSGQGGSPWEGGTGGGGGSGDLSRQAGLEDIGSGGRAGSKDDGRAASAYDSLGGASDTSADDGFNHANGPDEDMDTLEDDFGDDFSSDET